MDDQERSKVIDSAKKSVAKLETVVQEVGQQGKNILMQLAQVQQSSPIKRQIDSQRSSFSRPSQHNLEVVVVNPAIPTENLDEQEENEEESYEVSISSSSESDQSLNQYLFQRDDLDNAGSEFVNNPRPQSVRKAISMLKPLTQSPMASPRVLRLPNEVLRSFQLSPIESNHNVSTVNIGGDSESQNLNLINGLRLKFEELMTGSAGSPEESESNIKLLLDKLTLNMRNQTKNSQVIAKRSQHESEDVLHLRLESERKISELETDLRSAREDASKLAEYRDMLKQYQLKINSMNEPGEHLSKQLSALQVMVKEKDAQLMNLESQLKQIRESDAKNLLHVASLQREVSAVTNEVNDSKRAARSYQTKNVKLQELLDRAELAVKEKDMVLKDKADEFDTIINEKLEVERKLSEAVAESDKFKMKLKSVQLEKERQLENRFSERITTLEAENTDLKTKYNLLKSQTSQEMQDASDALAKSIDSVKQDLKSKEAECSELLSSNRLLKEEVEQSIEKYNSLELVHSQIKSKNKELMKDVRALEADRDTVKQKLVEVETERALLTSTIAELEGVRDELKKQNRDLEATQYNSSVSVDKVAAEKDVKISELEVSRKILIQQLTEVRNLNETIADEMRNLLDHSEVDVDDVRTQFSRLKMVVAEQQDKMKNYSLSKVIADINKLASEQLRISKNIGEIEGDLDSITADMSISDQRVRNKDEEIKNLIINLSETQKQLKTSEDMVTMYSGDILKLKSEKKQLGEIVQELQSQLDGDYSASTSQVDYIDNLEKQISEKDSDLQNLKEDLETLQLTNMNLRNEVDSLQSQISESKSENQKLTDAKISLETQLEQKFVYIKEQKAEFDSAFDLLRIEMNQLATDVEKERSEKKSMKEKLESTILELKKISTNLNQSNGVVSAAPQHVEVEKLKLDLNSEHERFRNELAVNEKLRSDLRDAKRELGTIEPKLVELQNALDFEKSSVKELQRQLDTEKLQQSRAVTAIHVDDLQNENSVLKARLVKMEKENDAVHKSVSSEDIVITLKTEIDEYLKEISSLKSKLSVQEHSITDRLLGEIKKNSDEIFRLKHDLVNRKSEVGEEFGASKLLKSRIEELTSENRKYYADITRLNMEIESYRRIDTEKTSKIDQLLQEIEGSASRTHQQQLSELNQLGETEKDLKISRLSIDLERRNLELVKMKDELEAVRKALAIPVSQISENNYFTQQIELLKKQNNEKALRISQLMSEISLLHGSNMLTHEHIDSLDSNYSGLESERLKRQLSERDRVIERLNGEVRQLSYETSTLKDEIQLKQKYQLAQNDSTDTVQRLESIIKERTVSMERLEKEKNLAENNFRLAKTALSEVELRCSHLMAELSAKDNLENVGTLKLLSLKSILSSFKSQFKQQQLDIEDNIRSFGGSLRSTRQRVELDKMDAEILKNQLDHEQGQLKAAKRTLTLIEAERDELQTKLDRQSSELRSLKMDKIHSDKSNSNYDVEDVSRNYKNEVRILNSELQQTQDFKKVLESDVERLRSRIKILEERLAGADEIVYRYRRDLQSVNDEMNRLKHSQQQSELDLSNDLTRHGSYVNQLEDFNRELMAKVQDLELLYEEQTVIMDRQEKIMDNLHAEVESYRKQIQIISSEKRSLESKIDSSVKVVIDYEHLVDNQKTETSTLLDQIYQQAEVIDGLNSSLEIRAHELEILKRDLESRSELLNRIQSDNQATIVSLKTTHAETITKLQSMLSYKEDSLKFQMDSLKGMIRSKDEELNASQIRYKELENELSSAQRELMQKDVAASEADSRLQVSNNEFDQLKLILGKEKENLSVVQNELEEQKARNQKLADEIKSLVTVEQTAEKLVEEKNKLESEIKKISEYLDSKLDHFKYEHKPETDCTKKIDILTVQITKLHRLRDGYIIRIQELESSIRSKDDVLAENAEWIKELEQDVLSLTEQIHEFEARIDEETQSLDVAQDSRARLQFQVSQLESQVSGNEKLLSQKDASIKDMCEKLASIELQNASTTNLIKSLQSENEELKTNVVGSEILAQKNSEILVLNDKLSALQISFMQVESDLKQKTEDFESDILHMQERIDSANNEVTVNTKAIEELSEQLKTANEKIRLMSGEHQQTCIEMKSELEKMAEDLIKKDGCLNQKEEECKSIATQLEVVKVQISKLNTQYETSVTESQILVDELRKKLNEALKEKESMLTAKDLEINSLVDRIGELEIDKHTASQGEQGLYETVKELRAAQKELSEELENVKTILQDKDKELELVNKQLVEREGSIKELSEKLSSESLKFATEMAKLHDELQIKQGQVVLVSVQIDELKSENIRLKDMEVQRKGSDVLINNQNLELVMKELDETKRRFEEYTIINQELDKSNEALRGRVMELQDELKKKNQSLRVAEDDKNRLSSELGGLKMQKALLDQTISEVQAAMSDLKQKRQQQESLIKQLEIKYTEAVSATAKNQKTDIQDIIEESIKLKDKLESVENLVKKYEVHRKHYKKKIADLEELMAMKESEVEIFTKELIDLRTENDRLVQFIAKKSDDTHFLIRQLSEAALALREGQQKDANGTLTEHDLEMALNQRSKKTDLFEMADKEFRESVDKIYREQLSIITNSNNNARPLETVVSPNIDNHVQNLLFLVEKGEQAIKSGTEIVKTHGKYQKRISKSTQKLAANENRTSTLFHV